MALNVLKQETPRILRISSACLQSFIPIAVFDALAKSLTHSTADNRNVERF